MFRLQIVERSKSSPFKTLVSDMRGGTLRTFSAVNRGKKLLHARSPGWIKWSNKHGVIVCEVHTRKEGSEWQIISQLIGRLADRYADKVISINLQFPERAESTSGRKKRNARRS